MDISSLEKMITSGRDSAMLRLSLARLLVQSEQWAPAADHLESAVAQDPAYTAAWKELGRVRQKLGANEAAAAAWEKGIEVAGVNGDKQAEKEMTVFLRRLQRTGDGG